jgi:hypothetical protein
MRKASLAAATCLVVSFTASPAFAWGAVVHRYIASRAIDLLPAEIKPFFVHFRDELVLRANDPDLWRLVFEDEAPNHQIDFGVDAYGRYPFAALPRSFDQAVEKFGMATIKRNGTLPWRVEEQFGNLRRALEGMKRNESYADGNAVLYAAVLGHYIQDAHQPLHVHNNYDGQLTAQNGIHSRFESELFERFESRLTIDPAAAKAFPNVRDFIFDVALTANQMALKVLEADKEAVAGKETYDDAYFEMFLTKIRPVLEQQLAASISGTASAVVSAWEQAGKPELKLAGARPVQKVRKP